MKYRMSPFVVDRAQGTRMWDPDGNEYIDWMGVGGAVAAGHCHPRIVEAAHQALDRGAAHPLVCYVHEPAVELAERLVDIVPGDFDKRVWFGVSGSDAMDFLAKVVPIASGRPRIITFIGAFHGMTIGSGGLSGHAALSKPIPGGHITKAPYANPYRCSWGPCDPSGCSLRCVGFLEDQILGHLSPPEETAAIFVESMQSDGGEIVPPPNFLPALRELCDRHGIWLIIDEIKTGLGRTGMMFGFEHAGIIPDAVALAKPLGGGFPLSAIVARRELLEADLYTAYTLGGSPIACSAALALLDVMEDEGLVENAARVGAYLTMRLIEMKLAHPLIGDVRGQGLLVGVELIKDATMRQPAVAEAAQLVQRCFELGLVFLSFGNVIEITPPLTITENEVDEGLKIFERALSEVEKAP
jgi:4-aminobutyrate aminotransferase